MVNSCFFSCLNCCNWSQLESSTTVVLILELIVQPQGVRSFMLYFARENGHDHTYQVQSATAVHITTVVRRLPVVHSTLQYSV